MTNYEHTNQRQCTEHDGWRVAITSITEKDGKKYVIFFAGYDTITEEIETFINDYTKEL